MLSTPQTSEKPEAMQAYRPPSTSPLARIWSVSNALPVAAARLDYSRLASYSNFNSQVKVVAIGGDTVGTYRTPVPCSTTTA